MQSEMTGLFLASVAKHFAQPVKCWIIVFGKNALGAHIDNFLNLDSVLYKISSKKYIGIYRNRHPHVDIVLIRLLIISLF